MLTAALIAVLLGVVVGRPIRASDGRRTDNRTRARRIKRLAREL